VMREPHVRIFTDQFLRALKPARRPYKRSEQAPKGEGRLIVRVLPTGVKEAFYRYRANGKDKTLSLGRYDPAGSVGKTLADIRAELRKARRQQRDTGDVKEYRRKEKQRAVVERKKGSFADLLSTYVESLRSAGKWSADQVDGIFRRHVLEPFPALADAKASDIEPEDVQRILAKMVGAGIGRQVNITRAYLRAAFAYGGNADYHPRTVANDGVLFRLKRNPVILVPILNEYERAGERTLSEDELRWYWKALDGLPVVQRATLRLNLALACQRPSQLLRATWQDFDLERSTLLLRDTKGRGGSRDHLLPLTPFALEQLKPLQELNARRREKLDRDKAPVSPFTADGRRLMVLTTLSVAVREVSDKLKKDKKVPLFQLRDLRRTSETMLQQLGIDREVRAHLLSHGRGQGVQGRHYERYDFLHEKRLALLKWARHLERVLDAKPKSKIVPIRGRAN